MKLVRFRFACHDEEGIEISRSSDGPPLEVHLGTGLLLPKVEEALSKLQPGEKASVTLPVADAYGPKRQNLEKTFSFTEVPDLKKASVGSIFDVPTESGLVQKVRVVAISDTSATVDFNSIYAAKTLQVELELCDFGSTPKALDHLSESQLLDYFPDLLTQEERDKTLTLISKVGHILEKLEISWFIVYGTLLGAVRHGGFIPWDDDFDIALNVLELRKIQRNAPLFREKGIGLVKTPKFWKFYDLGGFSIANAEQKFPWNFPFVDVFPYRIHHIPPYSANQTVLDIAFTYWDRMRFFPEEVLPLSTITFENRSFPAPARVARHLQVCYGADWKEVCVSPSFHHKTEEYVKAPVKRVSSEALKQRFSFLP